MLDCLLVARSNSVLYLQHRVALSLLAVHHLEDVSFQSLTLWLGPSIAEIAD